LINEPGGLAPAPRRVFPHRLARIAKYRRIGNDLSRPEQAIASAATALGEKTNVRPYSHRRARRGLLIAAAAGTPDLALTAHFQARESPAGHGRPA
jgi:hypothetical protein